MTIVPIHRRTANVDAGNSGKAAPRYALAGEDRSLLKQVPILARMPEIAADESRLASDDARPMAPSDHTRKPIRSAGRTSQARRTGSDMQSSAARPRSRAGRGRRRRALSADASPNRPALIGVASPQITPPIGRLTRVQPIYVLSGVILIAVAVAIALFMYQRGGVEEKASPPGWNASEAAVDKSLEKDAATPTRLPPPGESAPAPRVTPAQSNSDVRAAQPAEARPDNANPNQPQTPLAPTIAPTDGTQGSAAQQPGMPPGVPSLTGTIEKLNPRAQHERTGSGVY